MQPPAAGQISPEKTPLVSPPQAPPGYYGTQGVVYYQPPSDVIVQDRPRNVRRRRFWHFLACTFVAVAGLHILFKHGFFFGFRHRHFGRHGGQGQVNMVPAAPSACFEEAAWEEYDPQHGPHHSDVDHYPFHKHASFELPLDAVELFFLSEGSLAAGSITVSQSSDVAADKVGVEVIVHYHHQYLLDDSTVCSRHPGDEDWGVGIFTPEWHESPGPHREHILRFEVIVHLPTATPEKPLKLNTFRSSMNTFVHHLSPLNAYFDKVDLNTRNAPITAESLIGNDIALETRNGPVKGTLDALTSIDIVTANGPITVYATLTANSEPNAPASAHLKSSNGNIEGTLSLRSNASEGTGGTFIIDGKTSNAPLDLTVSELPVDAHLTLKGHSSNGPVRAYVHEAFEGRYDIATSRWFPTKVEMRTTTSDPAGKGRVRHGTSQGTRRGEAHGSIWWDQANQDKGHVELTTSNSPVSLVL